MTEIIMEMGWDQVSLAWPRLGYNNILVSVIVEVNKQFTKSDGLKLIRDALPLLEWMKPYVSLRQDLFIGFYINNIIFLLICRASVVMMADKAFRLMTAGPSCWLVDACTSEKNHLALVVCVYQYNNLELASGHRRALHGNKNSGEPWESTG